MDCIDFNLNSHSGHELSMDCIISHLAVPVALLDGFGQRAQTLCAILDFRRSKFRFNLNSFLSLVLLPVRSKRSVHYY